MARQRHKGKKTAGKQQWQQQKTAERQTKRSRTWPNCLANCLPHLVCGKAGKFQVAYTQSCSAWFAAIGGFFSVSVSVSILCFWFSPFSAFQQL